MTQRFAMPACESWQVPGGTLLYSSHNGAKITVTQEVAAVVRNCDTFLSLEEHLQRLLGLFPALREQPASVMQVLESLRDAGVLVPAEALCEVGETPQHVADGERVASKPSICITTSDRPELVRRLFDSLLRHVRLSRFQRVYLIDDSRDPAAVRQNAEATEAFRVVSPIDAVHVCPERQRTLAAALGEAVPAAAQGLQCLLEHGWWKGLPTYGRARNLALLLTAGQRCLMLDDDVLCEAWWAPGRREGVAFGGEREVDFLHGPADLQRFAALGEDPLQAQVACLGLSLDDSLRSLGHPGLTPDLLADTPVGFLGRVAPDARILVTQCGTLGDPGTEDNSWLALVGQESVQRLLAHPGGLAAAFASRQVWLGYAMPTFTDLANMSQVTGLDNRALLPPYLSGLRGEDRLFGTLTGYLHPQSLVLDQPWAIAHRPLPERQGNPRGDACTPRGGASLLDEWLMERMPAGSAAAPEARLALLAGELGVLAGQSDRDLRRDFGRLLTGVQVDRLHRIEAQLRSTGAASEQWRSWLAGNHESLLQALQTVPSPLDARMVPTGTTEAEIWSATRATAAAYATLLQHWPALRGAAAGMGVGT